MEQTLDNNISQTGYRTLFILQLLINGPIKKSDIQAQISINPYLKDVTLDTIQLDINTLRSVGFDIKSGNKANNYCYELKSAPIKIKLSQKEKNALTHAKQAILDFFDYRYIISLYRAFEKITKLVNSKEDIEEILNFGNFARADFEMVKKLDMHARVQNELKIIYNSPLKGGREMTIICLYLQYNKKSDKLYLWCHNDEYGGVIYLRADKIVKILEVTDYSKAPKIKCFQCDYKISRQLKSPFELEEYEKVVKINPEYIQIRANYYNEFNFVQRLLYFGADLLYVSNKNIKERLIEELELIRGVYNEKN